MSDLENLNHAEMKLDEAIRSGNAHEREFWRGYVHGLRVKIAKTEYRHVMEEITRAKMEEDA